MSKKTDVRLGIQTEELNTILTTYGQEKGVLFSNEELKVTSVEVDMDFTGIEAELHEKETIQ